MMEISAKNSGTAYWCHQIQGKVVHVPATSTPTPSQSHSRQHSHHQREATYLNTTGSSNDVDDVRPLIVDNDNDVDDHDNEATQKGGINGVKQVSAAGGHSDDEASRIQELENCLNNKNEQLHSLQMKLEMVKREKLSDTLSSPASYHGGSAGAVGGGVAGGGAPQQSQSTSINLSEQNNNIYHYQGLPPHLKRKSINKRDVMCGVCVPWRVCVASHVLWSMLYIVVGAIQLIAGIFFLISLPVFKIGSNIWTGVWNVIAGVGGAVFSCVGDVNPNKQQVLLYLTISVLVLNVVNLVVLELGEWRIMMPDAVKVVIEEENLQTLVLYARIMTSISTGVAVITSFVDAQFMFCWLEHNLRPSSSHHRHHNETVNDIEYVIPRVKSSSNESQGGEPNQNTPNSNAHVYNQYAQSWVFDTETVGSSQSDSPYSKLQQFNGSKTVILKRKTKRLDCEQISNSITSSSTKSKSQPMVLVEDTTTENERQLQFMTSFSRTPSPVAGGHNSDSSSPTSNPPMIYECLERLTEPSVYRSRLNTTFGMNPERTSPCISPRPHSIVVNDQVQYASLMIELEKTIGAKFPVNKTPSENRSENITRISSRRSSSHDENNSNMYQNNSNLIAPNLQSQNDTDFSKELEAALQLIQDLESPITGDTPSDNPLSTFHQQHIPNVNASYTIDDERVKPRCLVSQLTEGSIDRGILSSSSNSDGKIQSQFCYLHHKFCCNDNNCYFYYLSQQKIPEETDNFNNEIENSDHKMLLLNNHKIINVVSKSQNNDINTIIKSELVMPSESETENNSLAITTISSTITNNNNSVINNNNNNNNTDVLSDINEIPEINFKQPNFQSQNIENSTSSSLTSSSSSSSVFTRFKSMMKSSKNRSTFSSNKYQRKKLQLLPELENAILKSESLVHLSDVELVQRYNRNKYIHRKIEEKALKQINGASNTDTSC